MALFEYRSQLFIEYVGIARFLKYLKHKVYTPRPKIHFFTAVKHGNFQMKMYDIFFFSNENRSRVHISEQAGLCRTCRSPEESFSCCSSRKRHNIR